MRPDIIVTLIAIAVIATILVRRIWRAEKEYRENDRVERIVGLMRGVKER